MTTTGEAMLRYLQEQTQALRTHSPGVVNNDAAAVHDLRLATRRLRSGLASARRLYDREAVAELRAELKWLGGVLGAARDSQVIHERLTDVISSEPPGQEARAVSERAESWFRKNYAVAHAAAAKALGSRRFRELLEALDSFLAAPPAPNRAAGKPARSPATKSAGKGMAKLAAREASRVRRMVEKLPDPPKAAEVPEGRTSASKERNVGLHEVRKAAKRLRYVAEAAAPHVGKPAERVERRAHDIQKVLGVHQDAVIVGGLLKDVGTNGLRAGESGFVYGRLHAHEEQTAREADEKFRKLWKGMKKKDLTFR